MLALIGFIVLVGFGLYFFVVAGAFWVGSKLFGGTVVGVFKL